MTDPRRRSMAIRAFLCQNVAIGAAFGSFGVAMLPLQSHFGVGRGMASFGIALSVLTMGLAAPLSALLIERIGLRATMLGAIVLSGIGYVMLAFATSVGMMLFAFALPIGLGLVGFGPFPATVLAGNWYRGNAGPAIGFVNMPVAIILVPMAAVPLIRDHGLTGLYLALAGLHLMILPVAWGIVDSPEGSAPAHGEKKVIVPASAILRRPMFWAIASGSGVLSAIGVIASAHIVAFGIERGVEAERAALLVSVMGGASVIGAFGAGLLCARMGAGRALSLIAAATGAGWLVLFAAHTVSLMAAMTLLIGSGAAAVFPAVSLLIAEKFGQGAVTRTLGLYGMVTLPLTFGLPPLAGRLHDVAQSYDGVVLAVVGGCATASILYFVVSRAPTRPLPLAA